MIGSCASRAARQWQQRRVDEDRGHLPGVVRPDAKIDHAAKARLVARDAELDADARAARELAARAERGTRAIEWPAVGTAFDDSVAVLHAAEQGHGLALARWSLAASAVQTGQLVVAHPQALHFARHYYFVCPKSYLELKKVAAFRTWIAAAAARFPKPAN